MTIIIDVDRFEQQHEVTSRPAHRSRSRSRWTWLARPGGRRGHAVDVTQPFFPFGLQPRPGAALYFSHAEAFGKPGARLRIYVQPSATPQDGLGAGTALSHPVSWEYWDGRAWVSLKIATAADAPAGSPPTRRARGQLDLVVPATCTRRRSPSTRRCGCASGWSTVASA